MRAKTGPRDKYIETRSHLVQTRTCVHKYVLCARLGSLSRLHLPGSCGAGLCMHVWRLCVPIQCVCVCVHVCVWGISLHPFPSLLSFGSRLRAVSDFIFRNHFGLRPF